MNVIKRNGQEVVFDSSKIKKAIERANKSVVGEDCIDETRIQAIVNLIIEKCEALNRAVNVEEIQDMVEYYLMHFNKFNLAKNYITYRYEHAQMRQQNTTDKKILSLLNHENEEIKQENSNKNPTINSVMRDYMAGEVSKDITRRYYLPEDIVNAHDEGIIHFHDTDYFVQRMYNCCLCNLEDMLQNGTVISGTMIEKPHSFHTACNIATQIIAQVCSNQYGGQTITLSHLAPFVDISRQSLINEVREEVGSFVCDEVVRDIAEKRLRKEIRRGVQTIQYQVITLNTTNGQAPFLTINMYLNEVGNNQQLKDDLAMIIEEMLKQRIQGVKNADGIWITPAFPKLVYVLEEDNVYPKSKYWYLTELAAKCTAKRMVPDYVSEKIMLMLKKDTNGEGHCYPPMGCRSFLTPDLTDGKAKFYGRFNQGVCTISLPDVALSSNGDYDKFWSIFEERLELCHRALMIRHEHLLGTKSDVAPILWQHGAIARLKQGETIDHLLYNGYSTISLGYAGLYECVKYMTGESHTDPYGKEFALTVMQKLNNKCAEWKKTHNIAFSVYGTPIESTTYRFASCLKRRFGIIEDITDHNYITNSYHVNVREEIDAFTKLSLESEFQQLSPGGAISYVEVPNMQNNIPAVLDIIKYIYDTIMYAELNTKSDYCSECGFDGEIVIEENEHGKLIWKCPKCGNTDQTKMSVARRTCGYIGSSYWNQGRTEEIKDRVLHVSTSCCER